MEVRVSKATLLAAALIVTGISLRMLPHAANFAPVGAIALFAGATLGKRTALWLPVAIMVLSDIILGLYPSVWFTWGAFALIAWYGQLFRNRSNWPRVPLGAIGSALIFFTVSNFGVWTEGRLYPLTWSGLMDCYAMAIPFLRNTFLSDLSYSVILFGLYAYLAPKLQSSITLPVRRVVSAKY
jgi:Family of unknown function (DUF6580)